MKGIPATRFEPVSFSSLRFPPLPKTVSEVAALLSDDSGVPDTARLSRIVNMDPVVAIAVLRRINSAYYGLRHHVDDIRMSVMLLGFLQVCNIVMTESMLKMQSIFHSNKQVHLFEEIMRMSIGAAAFAETLTSGLRMERASAAVTGSLLHIAGRLVLLYNRPDDYEALWLTSDDPSGPSREDERTIFGTDHVELGSKAVKNWNLPEEVVALVAHYAAPEDVAQLPLKKQALVVATSVAASTCVCNTVNGLPNLQPPKALFGLATLMRIPHATLTDLIESRLLDVQAMVQEISGPPIHHSA